MLPIDSFIMQPGGEEIFYSFAAPSSTTPEPVPLVLAFHGGGGNAAIFANQLAITNTPSTWPFLTVFVQGGSILPPTPGIPPARGAWNSGHSPSGLRVGRQDVDVFDAMLVEAAQRASANGWRVDQDRTYAVGFSNGAAMCYRLAAERSNELAAIAVVAGSVGGDWDSADGDPTTVHINDPANGATDPVSILHIHGLADTGMPFYGGPSSSSSHNRADVPVEHGLNLWIQHNGCNTTPTTASHPLGTVSTWTGGQEGSEVQLILGASLGHQVPVDVMSTIVPFFESHPKP